MRCKTVFIISLTSLLFSVSNGDDKTACLTQSKHMLKSVLKMFSECNKEIGMDGKTAQEYQDSLGCVAKCMMKRFEIMDKDDRISEDMVRQHVENTVPESLRTQAHEAMMKCVKLHDELDPKDPKCVVYLKLANCIQESLIELCGQAPVI